MRHRNNLQIDSINFAARHAINFKRLIFKFLCKISETPDSHLFSSKYFASLNR